MSVIGEVRHRLVGILVPGIDIAESPQPGACGKESLMASMVVLAIDPLLAGSSLYSLERFSRLIGPDDGADDQ
jgi:hypothetical protein